MVRKFPKMYSPHYEVWLGGYSQRGTKSLWRWTSDGEAFWHNGSIGRFDCWFSVEPLQHDDSLTLQVQVQERVHLYKPPPADDDLCLRARLPPTWATQAQGVYSLLYSNRGRLGAQPQCFAGSWWADTCEKRLYFICQGANGPPRAPLPPLTPPWPPFSPMPPHPPPAPPITPGLVGEARCCIDFDPFSPCCGCNHFCREAALSFTAALLIAMLPTWLFVLAACARRQQQPRHGAAMELTAWPSVPIGKWQFATLQGGILLAVAGLVPVSMYVAGNRWPFGDVHRSLSLVLLGTDIIFLAIRPSTREAHIVILASATLFAAMLVVGILYMIEAVYGWRQALKARREWPQVAFDASLGVLLLFLALPLVRNLRPRGRRSVVAVVERLNRLWFVWRTFNLIVGLGLFTVFTLTSVSQSVSDALLRMGGSWQNESIFQVGTAALCILSAWLPTAQRRFRLSLLFLRPRVREQPEVDTRSVELFRADVPLSVASADWPENPPGLAAALIIEEQPKVLGRGGFGVVYAAQLEGKQVAIKQLWHLPNQAALRRFRREADLLTAVDGHPHLCRGLGTCLMLGLPAIVLDRYEGGSLCHALGLHHMRVSDQDDSYVPVKPPVGWGPASWVPCSSGASAVLHEGDGSKSAPATDDTAAFAAAVAATRAATTAARVATAEDALVLVPQRAVAASEALRSFVARWQLVKQLASGLEHLHSLNVHHLDIKPENVLLDRSHRHAVLSDFGLSRRTSALSEASPVGGSQRYMAPEVMFERFGYASDVYSFALLMWTLAYGRLCFAEYTAPQVIFFLQSNPATFRPALSAPPALDLSTVAEVPEHIWEPIKELIQECWHAETVCRPMMGEVVGLLHSVAPTAASAAMSAAV